MLSRTYTVGPSTKTNSISSAASTMFRVDSHLTPLCRPEKADATKAAESATMMISWTAVLSEVPVVSWSPLLTWRAPRPRLVAVPKTVAKTASRSIRCPSRPPARRSPTSGTKAELSRLLRPLRKPA